MGERKPITLNEALNLYQISKRGESNEAHVRGFVRKLQGMKYDRPTMRIINVHGIRHTKKLHNITTADLEKLATHRKREGNAAGTIRQEFSTLRQTIALARKLGYLTPRDVEYPKMKRKRGRLRFLDVEEEMKLLNELDPTNKVRTKLRDEASLALFNEQRQDNYDLCIVLLETGMRVMEASAVSWSSIDFEKNTIHIHRPKVSGDTVLFISNRLYDVLFRRASTRTEKDKYVFSDHNNGHRNYSTSAIKRAINKVGLNDPDVIKERGGRVVVHTLRHTFASKLATAGTPLHYISQCLGHTSINTTEIYAHLIPSIAAKAALEVLNRLNDETNKPKLSVVRDGEIIYIAQK